jgi:hypothetical protein
MKNPYREGPKDLDDPGKEYERLMRAQTKDND